MIEIPDPHRFEPNKFALKLWLFTRKKDKAFGMNDVPGFFSTHDFPKDKVFFVLAMFLELLGITLLVANGVNTGDVQFALIAIIGAVALSVFDILLAYFLHRNFEKRCYALNKVKVSENQGEKAVLRDDLKKGKAVDLIIIFGIIFFAAIKLLGIVMLGTSFDHTAIIIALAMMFVFIVYVHVKHTGYFLYAYLTKKRFEKQLGLLNRGDQSFASSKWTHYFDSDISLLENEVELIANQNHKITKVESKNSEVKFAYNIVSNGILTDRDITAFLQGASLSNDQIMLIAGECLKFQLIQYDRKT